MLIVKTSSTMSHLQTLQKGGVDFCFVTDRSDGIRACTAPLCDRRTDVKFFILFQFLLVYIVMENLCQYQAETHRCLRLQIYKKIIIMNCTKKALNSTKEAFCIVQNVHRVSHSP